MIISEALRDLLVRYSLACKAVDPNAAIMCGQPTPKMVDACGDRMSALSAIEGELFELPLDGIPPELADHIKARRDSGCSGCWLSSRPGYLHPECGVKILRYFDTRKALRKYVDALTPPT